MKQNNLFDDVPSKATSKKSQMKKYQQVSKGVSECKMRLDRERLGWLGVPMLDELYRLIDVWNDEVGAPGHGRSVCRSSISEETLQIWIEIWLHPNSHRRGCQKFFSPDSDFYVQSDRLADALKRSTFAHGQRWFTFKFLLIQTANRKAWHIQKLVDGYYVDQQKRKLTDTEVDELTERYK